MNIPINSIAGYIGLALLVFGVFMVLAGFDVISIQQVTVRKGKKTWILGIVFALLGVWLLLPELGTSAPAVGSLEPSEPMLAPTTVSKPLSPSETVAGSPIVFNIPNANLWDQSVDGSYTVTGNEDTIAWSTVIVEGDIEISFDIQFQGANGEGNIIIYGNGSGLSDKQLFFGFGPVLSKIMGGSPFDSRYLDDVGMTDVDINKHHSVVIRIVNKKANLFFDGNEILSASIPEDINTSGKIGIYKYHGETGMGDNGATYSNFRLTASSIVEP